MSLRTFLSVVLIVALAGVTDRLRSAALRDEPSTVDSILDVPPISADVLRVMSLGFTSLAADFEYLTAIQIFGDGKYLHGTDEEKRRRSLAVYRLLDYTTDFDPDFGYAYIFGANAIPLGTGDGEIINANEAIQLLKKAMRKPGHNCSASPAAERQVGCDWRIPFYLGYMMTTYQAAFADAAKVMAQAARRPHSPPHLGGLAARLAAMGGAIDAGIEMAAEMEKTAETDDKKTEAHERILSLLMERDIRMLETVEQQFQARNNRVPKSLQELVDTGFMRTIPPEAHQTGGEYVLDPATGEISSTVAKRLRLPDQTMEDIKRATHGLVQKATP